MTILRDVSLHSWNLTRVYCSPSYSFSGEGRGGEGRGDKETEGDGELYGKSSEKVISSRRIKLIRPAVVSRAYFKCHRCPLPPRSSSRNVCRRRNFSSTSLYGKAAHVIRAPRRAENERVGEADRDCAAPDTRRK